MGLIKQRGHAGTSRGRRDRASSGGLRRPRLESSRAAGPRRTAPRLTTTRGRSARGLRRALSCAGPGASGNIPAGRSGNRATASIGWGGAKSRRGRALPWIQDCGRSPLLQPPKPAPFGSPVPAGGSRREPGETPRFAPKRALKRSTRPASSSLCGPLQSPLVSTASRSTSWSALRASLSGAARVITSIPKPGSIRASCSAKSRSKRPGSRHGWLTPRVSRCTEPSTR